MFSKRVMVVILSGLLLSACSHTATSSAKPVTSKKVMHTSYYGKELAGRRTANGERFNPAGMTAAHKTLPFGTKLRVTNPKTKQTAIVRINDRGPFVRGRHLDVSSGAAKVLGFKNAGTAKLIVERVK